MSETTRPGPYLYRRASSSGCAGESNRDGTIPTTIVGQSFERQRKNESRGHTKSGRSQVGVSQMSPVLGLSLIPETLIQIVCRPSAVVLPACVPIEEASVEVVSPRLVFLTLNSSRRGITSLCPAEDQR